MMECIWNKHVFGTECQHNNTYSLCDYENNSVQFTTIIRDILLIKKSVRTQIFLSKASLQQPKSDQQDSIMEERYYQTNEDFTGVARSIYITAYCDISDLQSEEYQLYICERVFANDCTYCLLWEMAKDNCGGKIKTHHMAIPLQLR